MRLIPSGSVLLMVILLIASPAIAQPVQKSPHVRPHADLVELVSDAARQSPTIQALIDRLETLDVTVYVRRQRFAQSELYGRTGLLANVDHHRYLVIELACGRTRVTDVSTLAHELFHAVEIASEPSVVDIRSLAAFYTRTGFRTDNTVGQQLFETVGASEAGRQALRELFSTPRVATGLR
jgi:hypothetical protein